MDNDTVVHTRIELGVLATRGALAPRQAGHDRLDVVAADGKGDSFGDYGLMLVCRAGGSWWSLDSPDALGLAVESNEELGPVESKREAVRAVARHALVCLLVARSLDVEPPCS